MIRSIVILLAMLYSSLAWASPILISGFDLTDNDTTDATSRDTFNFEQTLSGGATDGDIRIQTTLDHDETNGGEGFGRAGVTASSHWAVAVYPTEGEIAYYQPCYTGGTLICENPIFPLTASELSFGLSVNLFTAPPADKQRRIMEIIESDDSPGCAIEVKSDRTLELRYDTEATALTTVSYFLTQVACSDNPYQGCTVNGDCKSDLCNMLFWPGLTLKEKLVSGKVICSISINGRLIYQSSGEAFPGTPSSLKSVRFGALETIGGGGVEAATYAHMDDFVLDDDDAGHGYVARLGPGSDGEGTEANNWTVNGCGASTHYQCLDDYSISPYTYDGSKYLQRWEDYKEEYFHETNPADLVALPVGASVRGVTLNVAGWTGAVAGTRKLIYGIVDYNSTIEDTEVVSLSNSTTDRLIAQKTYSSTLSNSNWDQGTVNNTGLHIKIHPDTAGTRPIMVGELLLSVSVRQPAAPAPELLYDHNKGDEDGMLTILIAGDSMLGASTTSNCVGNEVYRDTHCTFQSYCKWDYQYQDLPAGGCDVDGVLDDSRCQTCTGRREEANAGAGYSCNGDRGEGTGVISCGHTCTNDTTKPCDEDGDCSPGTCELQDCVADTEYGCDEGKVCEYSSGACCSTDADCYELGTCANTAAEYAECIWSCGPPEDDGYCPASNMSFADFILRDVNVDNLIVCPQGGETSYQLLTNRFSGTTYSLLDGTSSGYCFSTHAGSGKCRCTSDSKCETTSGGACDGVCVGGSEPWSACNGSCVGGSEEGARCTVDADCAGGGTCNTSGADADCAGSGTCSLAGVDKVCTASDNDDAECTSNGACESNVCNYPNPDYILIQSSINDTATMTTDPECTSVWNSTNVYYPCWASLSPTACTDDRDCELAVHKDSKCTGRYPFGTDNACGFAWDNVYNLGTCTVQRWRCHSDTDCDIMPGNCTQDDATDVVHAGVCECDEDADCQYFMDEISERYDGENAKDYLCRESCLGGDQIGADCEVDSDCPSSTCGKGICFRACSGDLDCGKGICVGGVNNNMSCWVDSDCPGGVCYSYARSCDTGAGVCKGYCTKPSSAIPCTSDSNCRLNQTYPVGPLGNSCVGGSVPGISCSVDSECTGGGTCTGVVFQGYCDLTNKLCFGGTEPGTSCTVNSDCAGSGTCGTGCRCTGPHNCLALANGTCSGGTRAGADCQDDVTCSGGGTCVGAVCPDQYANYEAYLMDPSHSALGNYDAMQDDIDALSEGTPPTLVLMTIQNDNPVFDPENYPDSCFRPYGHQGTYVPWVAQSMIVDPTRFPNVVEFRDAFHFLPPYDPTSAYMYRDRVHLTFAGAEVVGTGRINPWFSSINACSKNRCTDTFEYCSDNSDCATGLCQGGSEPGTECTVDSDCAGSGTCNPETCSVSGPVQEPQRYCQESDGDWTSTTCDDRNPCSDASYTCSVRPCTCLCVSNACTGSAGRGVNCSSGVNACCVAEFGVGSTCSAGICADACPAAGDACNAE